jgi:hypothetical protein
MAISGLQDRRLPARQAWRHTKPSFGKAKPPAPDEMFFATPKIA